MTRRVLFCGSRGWDDPDLIRKVMETLVHERGRFIVVHGGARGADTMAGAVAKSLGLRVEKYPAKWNSFGKKAGYYRNVEMADTNPELVVAFQKEGSRGTQLMLDIAERRRIPRIVYTGTSAYIYN